MGGSVGKSESEAENAANFDQKVWSGQTPALQDLYGQVGNLFGQTTSGCKDRPLGQLHSSNKSLINLNLLGSSRWAVVLIKVWIFKVCTTRPCKVGAMSSL